MTRDLQNKMIAGVCAGIAKSLKIDPIIVRIAFILATIWGFAGVLIYAVLWVIMKPENGETNV